MFLYFVINYKKSILSGFTIVVKVLNDCLVDIHFQLKFSKNKIC